MNAGGSPLKAVFWSSAAILAYEILLSRIFAVSQWSHLVFLVLSIALFGLAAGGTLVSSLSLRDPARRSALSAPRRLAVVCGWQSLATIGAFVAFNRLPLDYWRLPLEPLQPLYLAAAYLLLAAPFFAAGVVVAAAFADRPRNPGAVYFAAMGGSACGVALPLPLVGPLGEPALVAAASLLPLLALPWRRLPAAAAVPAAAAFGLAALLVLAPGSHLAAIRTSEYKGLSQALRLPDIRQVASKRSLRGHLDVVAGPHLRFAPGLSLTFGGRLPPQQVVFTDRDVPLTLYAPGPENLGFARVTLSYLAYAYHRQPRKVLAIPRNGGLSVACALAAGASEVRVVIRNPQLAAIVGRHYGLAVAADDPRAYLARTRETYDVIHLENWGATIPGADALVQDHGLTLDALTACLARLSPTGVLTISRRLMLPPADSLRMLATALDALAAAGVRRPAAHLALLRNWDTYTLLVSRRPLADPGPVLEFARRLAFDVVFLEGLAAAEANRFNVLPAPYYFQQATRLAAAWQSGRQARFFSQYPLDVAPQGDLRPFPGRFLKWTHIADLYRMLGRRPRSLFLSGEVVVVVVLAEALALSALLLLAPARRLRRAGSAAGARLAVYFAGLGCGFMFLELYHIHLYTFLYGDPVIAFGLAATCLLVYSAAGGLLAERAPRLSTPGVLIALCLAAAASGALPYWARHRLLLLPDAARCVLGALVLAPSGVLMGMPLPIGMRRMAPDPAARAYGWSANGCASVVAAVLAAQIAIGWGLAHLLAAGLAAYAASLAAAYGLDKGRNHADLK